MVHVIGSPVSESESVDELAFKVFIKALEILGGPRRLVEYRNLTWVPSLMAAAYAVVLHDKKMKTYEEIAAYLGLSKQTVERMLRADPAEVLKKISGEWEGEKFDEHIAGGLAKEAWRRLKEGEEIGLAIVPSRKVLEAAGGPVWAVLTLTRIKGVDFPVNSPEELRERLRGIEIDGKDAADLLDRVEYPIRSPAELLKKLREAARQSG